MASTSDFKLLLDSIPNYDGNHKTLSQFVMQVEEINTLINSITPPINALQKKIVFLTIKNKIVGKANEQLRNINFSTWEQLKTHLTDNFSDRQSPESVIIEIIKMEYNNKNVFKILSEVKEKFDLFRAKINLMDGDANSKTDIIKFQEIIITNNFVSSLKDPLRNNLATRGPKTLLEMEQLLVNDFQYLNIQNSDVNKIHKQTNYHHINKPTYVNKFPNNPINLPFKHNQQRDFAPRQRIQNGQNIKPTPMSLQTRQTFRTNPSYKNTNNLPSTSRNPNYIAEELFTNETDEYAQNNDYDIDKNLDDNQIYQTFSDQNNDVENSFLGLNQIDIQEKS